MNADNALSALLTHDMTERVREERERELEKREREREREKRKDKKAHASPEAMRASFLRHWVQVHFLLSQGRN